jgi:hypothetical protein
MKPIIVSTPNAYGFGHDWTLVVKGRSFYLGQDAKFCQRVLGMRGSEVAEAIGSNDLSKDTTRRRLAAFIIQSLGLDQEQIETLEPWELCCQ